jgi:hypothetical protein
MKKINALIYVTLIIVYAVELFMLFQMMVFLSIDIHSWITYETQEVATPFYSILNEPEAYLPWLIGEQKLVSVSSYISFLGLAFGYNLGAIAWFKLSDVYKDISYTSLEHELESLKIRPWISLHLKRYINKTLRSLIFERMFFVLIIGLLAFIAALIVLLEAQFPMMQLSLVTVNSVIICLISFVPVAFLLSKYSLKARTIDCQNLIKWYKDTYHHEFHKINPNLHMTYLSGAPAINVQGLI